MLFGDCHAQQTAERLNEAAPWMPAGQGRAGREQARARWAGAMLSGCL